MMNLGDDQKKLLEWLEYFCLKESNANICFIEGFSGLGKKTLAGLLQTKINGTPGFKTVSWKIPESSYSFDDLLLDLASELSMIGLTGLENAIFENKPPVKAIQTILAQEKICIIIYSFQNILIEEGQLPIEIKRLFENISGKKTLGKVIALTNQAIQRENWCDQIIFKSFPSFSEIEAVSRFDELLKEKGVKLDITTRRKTDIVNSLGKNPRGMNVFVQCLTWGTLDELIGELPEDWEARDREFSEKLLVKLEEALIRRSLTKFTDAEIKILENLSAMRKPFQKEAIERMNIAKPDAVNYRVKYSQYYFLEQNSNWFNLHPVLKEICKHKLSTSKNLFRAAHSMAAEYYTRHFFHKELKNVGRLGGYFVEARYHLLMAESAEKLSEISKNFEHFIHATINSSSPIPKDPQLLNERIALLTAYLGSGGLKGLEYHLARCLNARGLNDDIKQALIHSERSVGQNAPVDSWSLNIRLDAIVNGLLSAINICYIAIKKVPVSQNSFVLYKACAELMAKVGQIKEAIVLLKEGIAKIPKNKGVSALYVICVGLMEKEGQVNEAIAMLKEGIGQIPASNNSKELYLACAELMEKDGQVTEAIAMLKVGIGQIPESYNSHELTLACSELLQKDVQVNEAIAMLKERIGQMPAGHGRSRLLEQAIHLSYYDKNVSELVSFSLYEKNSRNTLFAEVLTRFAQNNFVLEEVFYELYNSNPKNKTVTNQLVFGLLCESNHSKANTIIVSAKNLMDDKICNTWILALCAIKNKDAQNVQRYFNLLNLPIIGSHALAVQELIKYWWSSRNERNSPAYHYPHLPAKLTGFNKELSIASKTIKEDLDIFLKSELKEPELNAQTGLKILCVATEWFSKNGGLSSFNRQLCLTLASLQHNVYCLVPSFTPDEGQNALDGRVTLIKSKVSVGVKEMDRLNLKPDLPSEFLPDLIIGHDRITGPSMNILRRDFFPTSKTILFIHTSPGEIEWYKPIDGDKSMTQKAEDRERTQLQLAKESDLVVAVGQKLFNEMSTQLSGLKSHPEIIQFTPGLFQYGHSEKEVAKIPFCLLLGRVEDFELKGVDIAARALDEVYINLNYGEKPVFIIRGAIAGTGDELQRKVKALCSSPIEVRVKEYNPDEEILKEDIRRASIVLMPSRTEGFGLVGLEAISLNCPILISHNSGLAKLIEQVAPNESHHWIVNTTGDTITDSKEWSKKIEFILNDRLAANSRIKKTVGLVEKITSWESAVQSMIKKRIL